RTQRPDPSHRRGGGQTRHPLQHGESRLRAERPPGRRTVRRTALCPRGHAPHAARHCRRCGPRVRLPREPRIRVRDRNQPATRRWQLDRARPDPRLTVHPRTCVSAISTFKLSLPDDLAFWRAHGITNVGISVAKLEAFGWEHGTKLVADAVAGGLNVVDL